MNFNFLHNYVPDPIMFSLGFIQIYWYGFLMSVAMIAGIFLAQKIGQRYGINKDNIFDLGVYLVLFGLIGARIYDVLIEWHFFKDNFFSIFRIWEGGLSIHGGIIGGLIAGYFYTKKHNINYLLMADVVALSLALGQAIGRWGNYFNQELYGGPTDLPWGIPINTFYENYYLYKDFTYFHPAFLYESILNFFNFLFILYLHKKRLHIIKESNETDWVHKEENAVKLKILSNGNIFLFYLLNYSVIRFVMEFIRIDETAILFGFRSPQLVSVLLFIFIVITLKIRTTTKPTKV